MALSERLRNETRDLHARAERSGAMHRLLRGGLDRAHYCALLRSLHAIYEGLEAALAQHAPHPLVAPVCLPGLARTELLAADLRLLHGESWRQDLALPAAARRYARRLRLLARWQPPLLAAHAYVRYLGDLHGGQVLKTLVARTFALEAGAGTSFYGFGDRAATQALIVDFRRGLGEIGHRQPAIVDAIVREARHAFEAHCRLFEEIAPA
ncbi:MAG: biliverdin-producing heme oxygenase [Rubrivivax sp.]|nr:biliverdin-producing heme oxygenase [Rubrivivax sp.]